jgi:hypothetical protein
MKTLHLKITNAIRIFGLIIAGLRLAAPELHAQSYTITSYKISGGGGTSSNGQFSVSGTIGQPDASGAMTGGTYSLTGGFWSSISVVQTTGAPYLAITASSHQVVISWPTSVTGWTLQTNSNLGAATWGNYTGPVVNNSVSNLPQAGNLFYRLSHP